MLCGESNVDLCRFRENHSTEAARLDKCRPPVKCAFLNFKVGLIYIWYEENMRFNLHDLFCFNELERLDTDLQNLVRLCLCGLHAQLAYSHNDA